MTIHRIALQSYGNSMDVARDDNMFNNIKTVIL